MSCSMNNTFKNNYTLLTNDTLFQYITCISIIEVCIKYMQLVNGALYFCTNSDGGRLSSKDYSRPKTKYSVTTHCICFYGVVNSYSFAIHKKMCPQKLPITFDLHARTDYG
jgi:hypothetical protein